MVYSTYGFVEKEYPTSSIVGNFCLDLYIVHPIGRLMQEHIIAETGSISTQIGVQILELKYMLFLVFLILFLVRMLYETLKQNKYVY